MNGVKGSQPPTNGCCASLISNILWPSLAVQGKSTYGKFALHVTVRRVPHISVHGSFQNPDLYLSDLPFPSTFQFHYSSSFRPTINSMASNTAAGLNLVNGSVFSELLRKFAQDNALIHRVWTWMASHSDMLVRWLSQPRTSTSCFKRLCT